MPEEFSLSRSEQSDKGKNQSTRIWHRRILDITKPDHFHSPSQGLGGLRIGGITRRYAFHSYETKPQYLGFISHQRRNSAGNTAATFNWKQQPGILPRNLWIITAHQSQWSQLSIAPCQPEGHNNLRSPESTKDQEINGQTESEMQECYRTYLRSNSPMSLEAAEEELLELQLTTTPARTSSSELRSNECAGLSSAQAGLPTNAAWATKGRRVRRDEGLQRS